MPLCHINVAQYILKIQRWLPFLSINFPQFNLRTARLLILLPVAGTDCAVPRLIECSDDDKDDAQQCRRAGWRWAWMLRVASGRRDGRSSPKPPAPPVVLIGRLGRILNTVCGRAHVCEGVGKTESEWNTPPVPRQEANSGVSQKTWFSFGWLTDEREENTTVCCVQFAAYSFTRAHTVTTSMWFVLKCHLCLDCSYFTPSVAFDIYLVMEVFGKYEKWRSDGAFFPASEILKLLRCSS